ncbi:MAG: hypothetical protein JWP99_1381, partial [Devosia sp.]|nr:hypothetical protein [Devosia sp.]
MRSSEPDKSNSASDDDGLALLAEL